MMIKILNGVEVPLTDAEIEEIKAAEIEWENRAGDRVREERNYILAYNVDPIVSNPLRWGSMTVEQQQAWADYRQALLDVPEQEGFPSEVIWPVKPE